MVTEATTSDLPYYGMGVVTEVSTSNFPHLKTSHFFLSEQPGVFSLNSEVVCPLLGCSPRLRLLRVVYANHDYGGDLPRPFMYWVICVVTEGTPSALPCLCYVVFRNKSPKVKIIKCEGQSFVYEGCSINGWSFMYCWVACLVVRCLIFNSHIRG